MRRSRAVFAGFFVAIAVISGALSNFGAHGADSLAVTTPRLTAEGNAPNVTDHNERSSRLQSKDAISILQIGDSHTSADFFTGELRRRLQARYGQGATGYTTAGIPHSGVRSSSLEINTSQGWNYESLQKRDAIPIWLSGYNAVASAPDETMDFISKRRPIPFDSERKPIPFDTVEIESLRQPGGGAVDVRIDGVAEGHFDLAGDQVAPVIIRIPAHNEHADLKRISITTSGPGEVSIASVSILSHVGLTYNSVGYVGATVDVLNKIPDATFASALERINPRIVVLSFGTNGAANEALDFESYRMSYETVLKRIKKYLPGVDIVLILPPDFNQLSPSCPKDRISSATCRRNPAENLGSETVESWKIAAINSALGSDRCVWQTPGNLARVRAAQREIAIAYGLIYWDWASIVPTACGSPLMGDDHVHLTREGYRRSAEQFVGTLAPMIENMRADSQAAAK